VAAGGIVVGALLDSAPTLAGVLRPTRSIKSPIGRPETGMHGAELMARRVFQPNAVLRARPRWREEGRLQATVEAGKAEPKIFADIEVQIETSGARRKGRVVVGPSVRQL